MKEQYKQIRTRLLKSDFDWEFLEKWCQEENRRFDILQFLFNVPFPMLNMMTGGWNKSQMINDLVKYLDKKYDYKEETNKT